jgi:hypothetical protein
MERQTQETIVCAPLPIHRHGKNPFKRDAERIQSIEQLPERKIATLLKETEKRVVLFSFSSP